MGPSFVEKQEARYLEMNLFPDSQAANELIDQVIERIERKELRKRKRKAEDALSFRRSVSLVVSDLVGNLKPDHHNWAYISLNRNAFTGLKVGYKTFIHILNTLESLELIEVSKGANARSVFSEDQHWVPGLATRLRLSEAALDLVQNNRITFTNVDEHFLVIPNLRELVLKSSSSRVDNVKIKGRNVKFEETPQTREITNQLCDINKFLCEQEYGGMRFYGLRRIFNEGDHPDFDWNMGGRLYGPDGRNYQRLNRTERSKITINGKSVVEIDINASYLRILHGLRGASLTNVQDIYSVTGVHRSIVKEWIKVTLGHTGFHTRWPPKAIKSLNDTGLKFRKGCSYPALKPLVLEKFPVLTDWPTCGIRWSHLMYHESEAMIETMLTLQDMDIVSLPVHDSLIVTEDDALKAKDVMQSVLETRFGVPFVISGN